MGHLRHILLFFCMLGSQVIARQLDGDLPRISAADDQSLGIIYSLYQGRDKLWIGSENGLFYIAGDQIKRAHFVSNEISVPITAIAETPSHLIVATLGQGLYVYDYQTQGLQKFDTNLGLTSDFIYDLAQLPSGEWVSATFDGVDLIDLNLLPAQNVRPILASSNVFNVAARQNDILFTSDQSLFLIDKSGHQIASALLPVSPNNAGLIINDISLIDQNQVAVATDQGLYLYVIQQHGFKLRAHLYKTENITTALAFDSDAILVSGSKTRFLSAATLQPTTDYPQQNFFDLYRIAHIEDAIRTPSNHLVFSSPLAGLSWLNNFGYAIETKVIIETGGQYQRIDAMIARHDAVLALSNNTLYQQSENTVGSLVAVFNELESVEHVAPINEQLVIASRGKELLILDVMAEEVVTTLTLAADVQQVTVMNGKPIVLDANSVLHVITDDMRVSQLPTHFNADYITATASRLFAVDYYNGLFSSRDGQHWHTYDHSQLSQDIPIDCVAQSPTDAYYFCTSGNGIMVTEPETGRLVPSKLNELLNAKYIRSIVADSNGHLWVATNIGLFRAHPGESWIQRVDARFGIYDTDFEYDGVSMSATGQRLNLVGDNFAYQLNLPSLNALLDQQLNQLAYVQIDNISSYIGSGQDQSTEIVPIVEDDLVSYFVPNSAYLSEFSFSATDIIDHQYLTFEYRLLGLTETWKTQPQGFSRATFSALPYGEYQFQVRAINSLSNLQQPITSVAINVLPPWYLSYQAFVVYFLSMLALYFSFRYWQQYRAEVRRQQLEAFAAEKTNALQVEYEAIKERLDKTKGLFTNISHEIRTPLTLIIAWLNEVADSDASEQDGRKIQAALNNTQRLRLLVDQLLELENLEHKEAISKQHIDVIESMQQLVESLQPLFKHKRIRPVLSGRDKIYIDVIPDSFEKIFSNIIVNAIKYSATDSEVKMRVRVKGQYVEITIEDSGEGIAEDDVATIFKRFSRLKEHQNIQGSGVGLAVVKEFVERNSGEIHVKSRKRHGTVFTVSLPLSDIKEVSVAKPSLNEQFTTAKVTEKPQVTIERKTVLVVEDVEDMRRFIVSLLANEYNCIRAANGKEGIEMALKLQPDAIVADVNLPFKSGIELTETVRANQQTAHIPIILISAFADEASKIAGLKAQANDYLAKPFNPEELKFKLARYTAAESALEHPPQTGEVQSRIDLVDLELPDRISEKDHRFMMKLLLTTQEHYRSDTYNREIAATALSCTDRQLNRKLNQLIGKSFTAFLRLYRLKKSRRLLLESSNIANVAFDVGFTSASYFGSCFKEEFGMTPSEFIESTRQPLTKPVNVD